MPRARSPSSTGTNRRTWLLRLKGIARRHFLMKPASCAAADDSLGAGREFALVSLAGEGGSARCAQDEAPQAIPGGVALPAAWA
jgi:hypothetical protein